MKRPPQSFCLVKSPLLSWSSSRRHVSEYLVRSCVLSVCVLTVMLLRRRWGMGLGTGGVGVGV